MKYKILFVLFICGVAFAATDQQQLALDIQAKSVELRASGTHRLAILNRIDNAQAHPIAFYNQRMEELQEGIDTLRSCGNEQGAARCKVKREFGICPSCKAKAVRNGVARGKFRRRHRGIKNMSPLKYVNRFCLKLLAKRAKK